MKAAWEVANNNIIDFVDMSYTLVFFTRLVKCWLSDLVISLHVIIVLYILYWNHGLSMIWNRVILIIVLVKCLFLFFVHSKLEFLA